MSIDSIINLAHGLLLNNLPVKTKHTPSGWKIFNCPMCDDTRRRGGIITGGTKIRYNCFNCHFKTGWSPGPVVGEKYRLLAKALGASDEDIQALKIELLKETDLFDHDAVISDDYEFKYRQTKFDVLDLPDNTVSLDDLPDSNPVKQYAKDRGIYGLYPLLLVNDVHNRKRVTVPYTHNGELVGWTARHINPPNKQTAKYVQRTQTGYVFNIDRFTDSYREIVIVTEGVFDAILVDGISVLGNTMTPEQANLINSLGKRVILCPDRDKPGKELIAQAINVGWEVSFPPWADDCKDAADACSRYGRLLTVESIIKYTITNKTKIEVMMRMMTIG